MKKHRISVLLMIVIFTVSLLISGCTRSEKESTLKIGFLGKLDNLNPLTTAPVNRQQVLDAVYCGFYRWNDKWEMEPAACLKIPSMADKSLQEINTTTAKVVYNLREGLCWSDGTPVDTRDFLLYYQLSSSPAFSQNNEHEISLIKNIRLPNMRSFEMTVYNNGWRIPFIPLPSAEIQNRISNRQIDDVQGMFDDNRVFNGPYVVDSFSRSLVTLKKNNSYYDPAGFDTVEFHYFESEQELKDEIIAGNIHLAYGVSSHMMESLDEDSTLQGITGPSAEQMVLVPNFGNRLLAVDGFRKTLMYAMDRGKISDILYEKKDYIAESWISPRHPAYVKTLEKFRTKSPEEIEGMLTASGLARGSDGKLYYSGEPVLLDLLYCSDDGDGEKAAGEIRDQLEKFGIEINLVSNSTEVFDENLNNRNFKGLALTRMQTGPYIDLALFFGKTSIPSKNNSYQGRNYGNWQFPVFDELIEDYNVYFYDHRGVDILKAHQGDFTDCLPFFPIVNVPENLMVSNRLQGVTPRGYGSITWNIEKWRWSR